MLDAFVFFVPHFTNVARRPERENFFVKRLDGFLGDFIAIEHAYRNCSELTPNRPSDSVRLGYRAGNGIGRVGPGQQIVLTKNWFLPSHKIIERGRRPKCRIPWIPVFLGFKTVFKVEIRNQFGLFTSDLTSAFYGPTITQELL